MYGASMIKYRSFIINSQIILECTCSAPKCTLQILHLAFKVHADPKRSALFRKCN